jgi:uncharacterized membrane protein YphA (DoxX/SURF4 family)
VDRRVATATGSTGSSSSPPPRLPSASPVATAACRGFVYAASTMGVTGTRDSVGSAAAQVVEHPREVTDLPLCVGLGVSTRAQAAEVAGYADGVIVGSALVRALGDGGPGRPGAHRRAGCRRPRGPSVTRERRLDLLGTLLRLVSGASSLVAGALKVTNLGASALAVRAYQLLPYDLAGYVGYALPVVEIIVGLLLILGLFTRAAAVLAGLLMLAFVIGIAGPGPRACRSTAAASEGAARSPRAARHTRWISPVIWCCCWRPAG